MIGYVLREIAQRKNEIQQQNVNTVVRINMSNNLLQFVQYIKPFTPEFTNCNWNIFKRVQCNCNIFKRVQFLHINHSNYNQIYHNLSQI